MPLRFTTIATLLLATSLIPTGARAQAIPADAYLDVGARELVARARDRREQVDDAIRSYETVAREQVSLGLSAFRRDRLFFRREVAARITWKRDEPTRIEMLGARQVLPALTREIDIPDDLDAGVGHLAFDPAMDDLLVGLEEGQVVKHPLADGSEASYRFASGDTVEIRLPDGRRITLLELRAVPRRDDFEFVNGSFWIDAANHDVVRATYRPAREFDLERDLRRIDPDEEESGDEIPGIFKPIRADVRYITVEYGLWDLRWWLPRLIRFEGHASVGGFVKAPLRYVRTYSEYAVAADTAAVAPVDVDGPVAELASPDSLTVQLAERLRADTLGNAASRAFADLLAERWKSGDCEGRRVRTITIGPGGMDVESDPPEVDDLRCRSDYIVVLPADSATLLVSDALPASIFDQDEVLMSEGELRELADQVDALARPGFRVREPVVRLPWQAPGLLRYNRVEGLAAGVSAELDLGRASADATARLGFADLEPNGELGLSADTDYGRVRLGAYRRLEVAQHDVRALGVGNSLAALLFGVDDGEYYRALGLELSGEPRPSFASTTVSWRLFAERQSDARVETDFSARHLIDDAHHFRPNLAANDADLVGAVLRLDTDRGLDPLGLRWGAALDVEAAGGDFEYGRPALSVYATHPLGGLLFGVEGQAGTTLGSAPAQRAWFVGGTGSLRGYQGGVLRGTAFWRARGELATQIPAARIALFSDLGWAGPRDAFDRGRPLWSAGAGASLLDGLVRFDLARALREPTGWRISLYLDGVL